MSTTGVLLVQLGTPDSPRVGDVRRYLREFLGDPRVMDMPAPIRLLVLYGIILPFRPRRSAEAYEKIWTADGSPLLLHTRSLADALAARLGVVVEVGMRYGSPPIGAALDRLAEAGVDRIVVVPLFPQYSSAATGSAVAKVFEELSARPVIPAVSVIGDFHAHPGFVDAVAEVARGVLDAFGPDHVLFSYHGLPERQLDDPGGRCLREGCCDEVREANRFCYRAQCHATTAAVAAALDLPPGSYGTSFQSRMAGQRWIEPYTDRTLVELYEAGVRRLAVLTPSFVADCLETLEEIGIRAREQWLDLGGEDLLLVPCVNDTEVWVEGLARVVEGVLR